MKTSLVAALGAAIIGTLAGNAAHAAVKTIDFGVSALGGDPGISYTGASLDQSSAFDLDGALLIVTSVGAKDSSGLVVFNAANPPGTPDIVHVAPSNIAYGNSPGTLPKDEDIVKSWSANGDDFTETLTTVVSIDRATQNAITVTLSGTLSDTGGLFDNAPAFLILSANQAEGPGSAISVALTDTSTLGGVPETSTWVMMGLGFGALGYAATRKGKGSVAALPA